MSGKKAPAKMSPEYKAALASFTKDGKQLVKHLQELDATAKKHSIMAKYDMGVAIRTMTESEEDEGGRNEYGERIIPNLSILLGYVESDIYTFQKAATLWTKKQMSELAERVGKDGFQMAFQHIKVLVSVDKESYRNKLVEYVFRNGTSAAELAEKLRDDRGGKQSQGGRPPEKPKNVNQGLAQMTKLSKQLNARVEIWSEGVFDKIMNTPPDDYDPTLLRKLQEAQEQIHDARGSVEILSDHIDKALEQVEKFVEGPAESSVEETAEESDTAVAESNGHAPKKKPSAKGRAAKRAAKGKKKGKKPAAV